MHSEMELGLMPILTPDHWNHANRRYLAFTTAAIIAASIAAGGGVAGAAIKSSGAKSAAATQSAAGNVAANDINAATTAAQASGQTGIDQANAAIDKGTVAAGTSIDAGVAGANSQIDSSVADSKMTFGQFLEAANKAISEGKLSGNAAVDKGVTSANALYQPYAKAGDQGIGGLADIAQHGYHFDPNTDPSYQFQLAEGNKALERSAAMRGGAMGGAALKSALRYNQDYASTAYGKAYDRQIGVLGQLAGYGERANNAMGGNFMTGAALTNNNEIRSGEQTSANNMAVGTNLSNIIASAGQQKGAYAYGAGNTMAQILSNQGSNKANIAMQGNQWIGNTGLAGATAAGNARIGAANATAAGQAASANAWGGAVSDIGNSAANIALASWYYGPNGPGRTANNTAGGRASG